MTKEKREALEDRVSDLECALKRCVEYCHELHYKGNTPEQDIESIIEWAKRCEKQNINNYQNNQTTESQTTQKPEKDQE